MLKLKDIPTQPVALTTEALEARIDELEFEKLQSETEQLMVSAEGYRNIGTVLNSTGVLSLEAAALAEVAEQLVGGGSSNLSDGLESHVVSGLEAEGKGEGFMAKAKEIGAKIMEKIKQMIAWITAKFQSNVSDKAANIAESAQFKIDKFDVDEIKTSDRTHDLKVYPHEADLIKSPKNEAVRKFLSVDPFSTERNMDLYSDDDKWTAYLNSVADHLNTLAKMPGKIFTDSQFGRAGILLNLLPSVTLFEVMVEFTSSGLGIVRQPNNTEPDARVNLVDLIKVLPDVITEVEGVNSTVQTWVKKLKSIEDTVPQDLDFPKKEMERMMLHVRLLKFIVVTVPTEILRSYDGVVATAKLVK